MGGRTEHDGEEKGGGEVKGKIVNKNGNKGREEEWGEKNGTGKRGRRRLEILILDLGDRSSCGLLP